LPTLYRITLYRCCEQIVLRPLDATAAVQSPAAALKGGVTSLQSSSHIGDGSNPTALMATFVNTHGTLICTDAAPDAARVAAGTVFQYS
jgi:hypothetical protein